MSARRPPRPRDPKGRREAIVAAAVEVIAEHGLGNASHRLIAERADVPLGSTTYYFPTRGDLVASALEKNLRDWARELERWADALTRDPFPATLVSLAASYLADRARAVVEYELYIAAAREPELRELVRQWLELLERQLSPIAREGRARAIAMLVDGAIVRAVALDRPLDGEALEDGIAALMGGR
ncbi:TetR/AcrR family transcriptional regulator [Conexibacter arvalis]|uniref:DNA-binding transcriptional regulator YbjK n=1 Tax=Conexibacter arvalis TaxID=912552 RepID=A0A840IBH8_9ACTN|nr:TetR family transcriptional regulator [Conexibacter arvalis]MBB4662277.1 DNA-binding transcriptional regulator YbjK [Conexibacter arvalis]